MTDAQEIGIIIWDQKTGNSFWSLSCNLLQNFSGTQFQKLVHESGTSVVVVIVSKSKSRYFPYGDDFFYDFFHAFKSNI